MRPQSPEHPQRAASIANGLNVALLAIFAAISEATSYRGVDFESDGTLDIQPSAELSAVLRTKLVEDLTTATTGFAHDLNEVVDAAAYYLDAVESLPKTLYDAAVQAAVFQAEFEAAASERQQETLAWRDLDVMTGRIRATVVAQLVAGGMSATAADKAASGTEEYTSHKDATARALSCKEAAELKYDVAYQRLQTSRTLLEALVLQNTKRVSLTFANPSEPRSERAPSSADHDEGSIRARTSALDPQGVGDVVRTRQEYEEAGKVAGSTAQA